nr:RNA-directed DNA polymerase, eukaryota [Tanacetum cinerariifolium]
MKREGWQSGKVLGRIGAVCAGKCGGVDGESCCDGDGNQTLSEDNKKSNANKQSIMSCLTVLDKSFDQGTCNDELLQERSNLFNDLHDLNKASSLDLAHKAKIQWAIEGDENSKFFHGIINKKRSQLAIRGILVDGDWIDWIVNPSLVKNKFLKHFSNRFAAPDTDCITFASPFPNQLTHDQVIDLESSVDYDEIKRAIWDCAVSSFFSSGSLPPGCNSSFITLIPKSQEAKMVKDFRPISLIGSAYKIITKVLANRLSHVILNLVSDVQSAFIPDRQILDGPFILDELLSWWCLNSAMGSILVNGSPTTVFKFFKGLKQGDPLSPFLFILVIERFHLFFNNVVQASLFKARSIGCSILYMPFHYLEVMVGGSMSEICSWDDVVAKLSFRLSKWKLKTLSIGGRLNLIKSVLSSLPFYFMSSFKDLLHFAFFSLGFPEKALIRCNQTLSEDNKKSNANKQSIMSCLTVLDKSFDQGTCNDELLQERSNLFNDLYDLNKASSLDLAHKAKIQWAIEGDENSKFFHGIINKKRSQLAIRDLESSVDYDEIKRAIWDCGTNKSPGPDGFTFEFF